jgi:aspartate 1-decarboxylase
MSDLFHVLKAKIHRAVVTQAELDYVGSITIDPILLEAAGIIEHEQVSIVNIHNGARFETYVILGQRGSGEICLNGAAARLVQPGDVVIIIAYAMMSPEEAKTHDPKVVLVDSHNRQIGIESHSQH